jgi:hypothetical protein
MPRMAQYGKKSGEKSLNITLNEIYSFDSFSRNRGQGAGMRYPFTLHHKRTYPPFRGIVARRQPPVLHIPLKYFGILPSGKYHRVVPRLMFLNNNR